MIKNFVSCFILLLSFSGCAQSKMKALIVDGQNNHAVWPKSSVMMKQYLEETGLFEVEIYRSRYTWRAEREQDYLKHGTTDPTEDLEEPRTDEKFVPNFDQFDVVISNFGWKAAPWPELTQRAFEEYVSHGGGFVSVHAADNSFPQWKEYNRMIGIGGWGDRNESDGPYLYFNNDGEQVIDTSIGSAGAHGDRHRFPVTIRDSEHPITKGMPNVWMTGIDECYAKLRGPAENMTVLATGKDQSVNAPTDRHEPVLMVINYDKGRVFHTTLGHDVDSFENVGFISSFTRGVEWAATGAVSQEIPVDFPTDTDAKRRTFSINHD